MNPDENGIKEVAVALAETAKFGTQTVKTTEKILRFVSTVLKEPAEITSGIIGDRLRLFRWERQVAYTDKVNCILKARNITSTKAVMPKFALPILENASLEDDEDLQLLWARLMANAMDSNSELSLQMSFIEILKNLTALDAKILYTVYKSLENQSSAEYDKVLGVRFEKQQICHVMGISSKDYDISIFNLFRTQCLAPGLIKQVGIMFGDEASTIYKGIEQVSLTPLGLNFVISCIKDD